MDRSPSFGSAPADSARCSHSLSLRLRHRLRLAGQGNSQTHYAKGTQSPPGGLLQFGGARVQVLFHSPRGVLFTFPSRYWFAIGRRLVFSLGGWAPRIQAGFHVSRPTWDPGSSGRRLRARGCHPLRRAFPGPCARRLPHGTPVPLPRRTGPAVWASSAFARRYLRNHCCLLFLRLLRCFTSPGLAPAALWIRAGAPPSRGAGCPIRTPPDQGPHAPPRGFSQLAASFVACRRQGIRRAPVQSGRPKSRRPAQPCACAAARRNGAPACFLTKKRSAGPGGPADGPAGDARGDLPYIRRIEFAGPADTRGPLSLGGRTANPRPPGAVAGLLSRPLPKISRRPRRPAE